MLECSKSILFYVYFRILRCDTTEILQFILHLKHFCAQSSAHAHISILNVNIVSTLSETSKWIQKKTKPVIKDVIWSIRWTNKTCHALSNLGSHRNCDCQSKWKKKGFNQMYITYFVQLAVRKKSQDAFLVYISASFPNVKTAGCFNEARK